MPYTYYTKVTRDDALAIRAYLATLEPVRNKVIANQLPFPFNIRLSMAVWNALFFTPGTFKPVTGKSADWNRGAYLVEGLAHCGMCHTAKNFLGGDKTSHALAGRHPARLVLAEPDRRSPCRHRRLVGRRHRRLSPDRP